MVFKQVKQTSNNPPSVSIESAPACHCISLNSTYYSFKLNTTAPPKSTASLASLSTGSASNLPLEPSNYATEPKEEYSRATRPDHRRENSDYFTAAWISPTSSATCSERRLSSQDAGAFDTIDRDLPNHGIHSQASFRLPESDSVFTKFTPRSRHSYDEDSDLDDNNFLDLTSKRVCQYLSDQSRIDQSNSVSGDDHSVDTQSVLSFRTAINQRDEVAAKSLGLGDVNLEESGVFPQILSPDSASTITFPDKNPSTSEYVAQWLFWNSQNQSIQAARSHTTPEPLLTSKVSDSTSSVVDQSDPSPIPMETTTTEPGENQPEVMLEPNFNPSNRNASAPVMKPLPPPPFFPDSDSRHDEQTALSAPKQPNASPASKGQLIKGRSASEYSTPVPRKRLLWHKRTCFVSFPTDDPRTNVLTEEEVQGRLANWESLGYNTKGWDLPEDTGNDSGSAPSVSRVPFPDPDECAKEWRHNRTSRVSFPDRSQWELYVRGRQEEKLRALGVGLGTNFSSQSENSAVKVSLPNQHGPMGPQQIQLPSARIAPRSSPLQTPSIVGPHNAPFPPALAGGSSPNKKGYPSLANHAPTPFGIPSPGGSRYVTAPTRKNTVGSPMFEHDQAHPFPYNAPPYQPQSVPRFSPSAPAFYKPLPTSGVLERPTSSTHNMHQFNPMYAHNGRHNTESLHRLSTGQSPGGFNIGEQSNQMRMIQPHDQLTPKLRGETELGLSNGPGANPRILSPTPHSNPRPR